jgi:hypothetical protein
MANDEIIEAVIVGNLTDQDWFLQRLVNIVEGGVSFDITLNVSGNIVSGALIGGKQYFKLLGESFASGLGDNEAADSLKATFIKKGEEIYDENTKDIHEPNYLHLKDAKFFVGGGGIPSNKGVLWRGRISEISGFSLGKLS